MLSWRQYLLGGALAVAGIAAIPTGPGRNLAYLVVAISGVAAIVAGVRRHRPTHARAWYLMATGIGGWVIGDALYSWAPLATGPGGGVLLSDVFYLAAYPVLAAGLAVLVGSRGGERRPVAALDSMIFTVALGLLSWVHLIQPTWALGGGTLDRIVAVAYPVGDVLLLAILVLFATVAGTWTGAMRLLAGSIAALLAADSLLEAAAFVPAIAAHADLIDPVWAIAYVLWGAAALHPSMGAMSAIGPDRTEQRQTGRLIGLTAALVTGPTIIAGQLIEGVSLSAWAVVIASGILAVLVLVRMFHLVRLLHAQAMRLGQLADTDFVTGLANRRRFTDWVSSPPAAGVAGADPGVKSEWALSDPSAAALVLLIDVERFAELTDTLGHRIGDAILAAVGRRLGALAGPGALVARTGDHTFGVLESQARAVTDDVVRRLRAAMQRPLDLQDLTVSVEVSIGVLELDPGIDPGLALHRADIALSAAKDRPDRIARYGAELETGGTIAQLVIGELRGALDRGDIVVFYQPQLEIATGRVFGVEALSRWQHPRHGLLGPDSFIAAAERTGLIGPFTQYVLDRALAQCARWRDDGLDLTVAVNLSVLNLLDPDLVDDVAAALARHRLTPASLELEITESSAMVDPRRSLAVLGTLSAMGVTLSIDDFGTGHSSLAYLQRLPVRRLKMDRSFVTGILDDDASAAIVRSTIELARHLHLDVVAEGVEDDATLLVLRDMHCHAAQGFGLGRPVPAALVPDLVQRITERLPQVLQMPVLDWGR